MRNEYEQITEAFNASMDELQSRLDQAMKVIAMYEDTLKLHHDWHQNIGVVYINDMELDLSLEYSDSVLCEKTIKALDKGKKLKNLESEEK